MQIVWFSVQRMFICPCPKLCVCVCVCVPACVVGRSVSQSVSHTEEEQGCGHELLQQNRSTPSPSPPPLSLSPLSPLSPSQRKPATSRSKASLLSTASRALAAGLAVRARTCERVRLSGADGGSAAAASWSRR